MKSKPDVLIVGAGPAGAVAAAFLIKQGLNVLILEREQFPRFSIGESLLPQSTGLLQEAGMLQSVVEAGFQFKNGAAFAWGGRRMEFDFREKSSPGWGSTYQVQRSTFDKILADEAAKAGAEIRYGHEITSIDASGSKPRVKVKGPDGVAYEVEGGFLLDASGFGRVVSRMLGLETPSNFPSRRAIFTHIEDRIAGDHDRNKILIAIHPGHKGIWYWLIPFSNGRCSLGVVAEAPFLEKYSANLTAGLQAMVSEEPRLELLLKNVIWDTPARQITGYSCNVKSLWGNGFALLGNAGEFLDPVFSSGVTIALKSASLVAPLVARHLKGESVDWEKEYSRPLKKGVEAFRIFVQSWYRGDFQNIIFYKDPDPLMRRRICSILAGYAWDEANPFVADPQRLTALEKFCGV